MVCKSVLKTEDLEIHIDTFVKHGIYFFVLIFGIISKVIIKT